MARPTELTIINNDTGKVIQIDNGNFNIATKNNAPKGAWFPNLYKETTISIDINNVDADNFLATLGFDIANKPDDYDITIQKPIQIRTHKKKRINKKWAKRYGYVLVNIESKGWKITNKDDNFEFVKDISNSGESL